MQIAGGLVFGESLLSRRHKEMIATYVSWQNGCPYCTDSHAFALEAQGGSQEIIRALQHGDLNSSLAGLPLHLCERRDRGPSSMSCVKDDHQCDDAEIRCQPGHYLNRGQNPEE